MGRLYVPKPPKKRSDSVAKSKIIARAVFDALSTSKTLGPAASLRIARMGPKDSRGSTETNENVHPAGKGKGKAKISRTSSDASFRDLSSEAMDAGIAAVRQISKILHFAHCYHDEIGDAESIYGLGIRQQARIDELNTTVNDLMFREDQVMTRLRNENDTYRDSARQFERDREKLDQEQASMESTHKAMQQEMERQKEKDISQAKQEFSDKLKTKTKQIREEFEKKVKDLETDKGGLKDCIKKLEEKDVQAHKDLNQQKESLELDKRSRQLHIAYLESELHSIRAASIVSLQTPEFYIDSFHQLWERIRDVAVTGFHSLPEDTKSLDSDGVRTQLFTASAIFKYYPLSSESVVSTFLRGSAIQDFLSTKTISIIRQPFFAESKAAVNNRFETNTMDSILGSLSNVPAADSSQDLSWRLTTVDKLDRLGSNSSSTTANFSTKPDQGDIVDEIWDQFHHFQSTCDEHLDTKLSEIANITIRLWSALRKDSCQVEFNYDPSTGDRQEWDFVKDVPTNGFVAASPPSGTPTVQLPSKSFVLFPQITGSFSTDRASRRILHRGSALSADSPVFLEGLREIEHNENATQEFKRKLRRGSSAQSSPVTPKRQGDWPVPLRGSS